MADENSNGNGQRLLTAKQVADMLQMSEEFIHEVARRGDLPCVRLGRYRRFKVNEVNEWVESKSTKRRRA
jgi:excisionase family DNA binding protein